MALQFGDVQETALITLAIRASETAREKPRIVVMKAKEIIDSLGVDVSKFDPFLSHEGVVARTILFRNTLKDLLRQYPDAVCINLGCGFDDKFSQVDNGTLQWFDVDLPDQIEVRRKVFSDRDRCTMVAGNALEELPPRVSPGGASLQIPGKARHEASRCRQTHQRQLRLGHRLRPGISGTGAADEAGVRDQLQ